MTGVSTFLSRTRTALRLYDKDLCFLPMISDVALNYDPVVHTAISIHTALPAARDWLARTLLPNATSLHTIEVPILSWGGVPSDSYSIIYPKTLF